MCVYPLGALRKYNEINKTLPDRIIVFRDGVGDGQLAAVFEHEVKQFMECFKTVGFQAPPKFGFVVVKKRINSRFFMKNGRLQNPPPGNCFFSIKIEKFSKQNNISE